MRYFEHFLARAPLKGQKHNRGNETEASRAIYKSRSGHQAEQNRGKPRKAEESRGKPRKAEESRGKPRKAEESRGKPRKTEANRGSLNRPEMGVKDSKPRF